MYKRQIVTYTCKDRSGNKIVAKRKVSVVEKKEIGVYAQTEEKVIYLTFDDGPSKNTKRILDILDKYHAKATFFEMCIRDRSYFNYKYWSCFEL